MYLLLYSYIFHPLDLIFYNLINLLMSLLDKKTRIWKEGQTTIPFVSAQPRFSKSKRFKLYSIYWPERNYSAGLVKQTRTALDIQAYRISRLIDQQEKNQSRMTRGPIIQKSQQKSNNLSQPKNGFSKFVPTRLTSLSKKNQDIVFRLTSASELSQSKLRDRHGHRANVYQNQEVDVFYSTLKDQKKYKGPEKGFYTSRRINLNLPHNYYPGPGSYDIKRYLQQKALKEKNKESPQGNTIQNAK